MPRKDFLRDLKLATAPGCFPRLQNVKAGDDDGSICFTYTAPSKPLVIVEFQAVVPDVSEYPRCHDYIVYAISEPVPTPILEVLEVVTPSLSGSSIQDMLGTVSEAFDRCLAPDLFPTRSQNLEEEMDEAEDTLSDVDESWDDDLLPEEVPFHDDQSNPESVKRLRLDLGAAKRAGFKVGCLGGLTDSVIIAVSCRIAKLGISEEAMQAWNVRPQQYLVLLIRFQNKYLDVDQLMSLPPTRAPEYVQMHVGLCESYKPSLDSAVQAFAAIDQTDPDKPHQPSEPDGSKLLLPLFIDRPLSSLLNERFITILSHRCQYGHTWAGAELYFNDCQGRLADNFTAGNEKYFVKEDWGSSTPRWLQSDHLTSTAPPSRRSFPLLAMEFTLRHVAKCTEFCLVCYCKIDAGFEALKPYVCSKPLCLYQYMALGMGPSLEWEILTQPYVVDLLISFTYHSAATSKLEDFPEGLGFKVPAAPEGVRSAASSLQTYTAQLRPSKMRLHVTDTAAKCSLKVGDWIAIMPVYVPKHPVPKEIWHCRVNTTIDWPAVDLSDPIRSSNPAPEEKNIAQIQEAHPVRFCVYDTVFEGQSEDHKRKAILMLLDTLPNVEEMRKFLGSGAPGCRRLLSSWHRISTAALELMRWIVASNRSCILQDGGLDGDDDGRATDDLVSGMEDYMQFRFAQGAPDKEERFLNEVNAAASDLGSQYPTLFAWHGSPLHNWHAIVREGLNFNQMANGRSHGHGVYLARDFKTSLNFATRFNPNEGLRWPSSILNIFMAISLNEVVNAPNDFRCKCKDCYVVNKIDWIQTRYLFVQCHSDSTAKQQPPKREPPSQVFQQDPERAVLGPKDIEIAIPITALSQRRRDIHVEVAATKPKKSRKGKKRKSDDSNPVAVAVADDAASVATLDEDLAILLYESEEDEKEDDDDDDDEQAKMSSVGKAKGKQSGKKTKTGVLQPNNVTDFKPDTLTQASLTLLAVAPAYATSSATKTLQKQLQATLKVQEEQAPHELGWSVSPLLINTVYQWIVELHSFDVDLPLAKDLKKVGIQSVVLEMRFPKDYPMTPPFVRIVRPRFLEFANGGGGHVTAGGALCLELLTNTGWSPISSIESVLLQIRLALCSLDPRPAKLQPGQTKGRVAEYTVQEAVSAYVRACRAHGWEVPDDFQRMAWF